MVRFLLRQKHKHLSDITAENLVFKSNSNLCHLSSHFTVEYTDIKTYISARLQSICIYFQYPPVWPDAVGIK